MALSTGLVIGMALKPWKAQFFPKDRDVTYFILWACFWPAMLLHLAFKGGLAFRIALKKYLDNRHRI